jgi:predicted dehydrogenase
MRRAQALTGITKVYADYREMLDEEALDLVIFCPENARHGEVAEAIAARGVHMVTEKPMSSSLSDALRMVRAAEANNVMLAVNWPSTWRPAVRRVKSLVEDGVIGDVWQVKWRNFASLGPLSYSTGDDAWTDKEKGAEWWHHAALGGGALLDYCSYGASLACWLIGEPAVAAMGMKANFASSYGDADDNAIITVRFPKALAILEASWTTWNPGGVPSLVVYGTRGTLASGAKEMQVFTSRSFYAGGPDWVTEGDPLPEGRATLGEEVIHHLETGEPLHPTLQVGHNLEAMAILDAGIRSAASGKMELVNTPAWCVG